MNPKQLENSFHNIQVKLVTGEYITPSLTGFGYRDNDESIGIMIYNVQWSIFHKVTLIVNRKLKGDEWDFTIKDILIVALDGTIYIFHSIDELIEGLNQMDRIDSVEILTMYKYKKVLEIIKDKYVNHTKYETMNNDIYPVKEFEGGNALKRCKEWAKENGYTHIELISHKSSRLDKTYKLCKD